MTATPDTQTNLIAKRQFIINLPINTNTTKNFSSTLAGQGDIYQFVLGAPPHRKLTPSLIKV
jgi:hypothetical protein